MTMDVRGGVSGASAVLLRLIFCSAIVLAATLTVSAPTRAAAQDCAALTASARAQRTDIDALTKLHEASRRSCDAAGEAAIARALGFALYNSARSSPEDQRLGMLTVAATYADDWRILAALGSEQLSAGQSAAAAESLQQALTSLDDDPPAKPPPPEVIEKLVVMANNARAVAPTYVAAPRSRSGAPSGVAATRVAGVSIETVPFPIEFVFGEATITEDSALALEDLVEIVAARGGGSIVLAGHTDPVGSDAANEALSRERAAAIRDMLIASGAATAQDVEIVGCGERSKPPIESPEFYSEDEIHQIMRRVELVRSGPACP